jgi:hypothetical protein
MQRFDNGNNAPQFFFFRNWHATRPARFSTYVENVRALRFNLQSPGYGFLRLVIGTAIRKRIGCEIEDTHDDCPLPQ